MKEILEMMNSNMNWKEIIQKVPYNVNVREDGVYTLLKYDMLKSAMANPIVRQCRGSIFRQDNLGKWICVCAPFYKFDNYGQPTADKIDWASAVAMEKIDGSLIKLWWDCGRWHISTSGMIDAKDAVSTCGKTFYELFEMALGNTIEIFFNSLSPYRTYMFELVSPLNQLVVEYDKTRLYFLSSRDNTTFEESFDYIAPLCCHIRKPTLYSYRELEECIQATKSMTRNQEGFVVVDKNFHRVKIKSEAYLAAFHAINNGNLNARHYWEMIRNDLVDDVYSSLRDTQKKELREVIDKFNRLSNLVEIACNYILSNPELTNRKDYGLYVRKNKVHPVISTLIFRKLDNPNLSYRKMLTEMKYDRVKEFL